MAEIWDLVDADGRNVGEKWVRADRDKIPEGFYHPCVEVWVKVGDKLLITRRHPEKSEGLKYDVPGGAVLSGESISLGARRELFEEVGIDASESQLIFLGHLSGGKVFAASYIIQFSELPPLLLQPTEVVGYKLVGKDELEFMKDELTKGTYKRYLIYKNKIF